MSSSLATGQMACLVLYRCVRMEGKKAENFLHVNIRQRLPQTSTLVDLWSCCQLARWSSAGPLKSHCYKYCLVKSCFENLDRFFSLHILCICLLSPVLILYLFSYNKLVCGVLKNIPIFLRVNTTEKWFLIYWPIS